MEQEQIQDQDFAEFMAGLDDSFDYQTETAQETDTEGEGAARGHEADTDAQPGEENPTEEPPAEQPTEEMPANDKDTQPETFTLKVNKEERTCTREEVIELAQKGADYDRVKEQLRSQQDAMDVLTALAKEAQTDIPGLLDSFRISMLKKQGLSDDAAKERLGREKAERENAALKAAQKPQEETGQERARREIAEFRKVYPKVELTDELVKKLMPDVQSGKTITEAYRALEAAEKDAKIAELERQLEAEKQNRNNRIASPGSQKDSGGRRTKDDFDEFMKALE